MEERNNSQLEQLYCDMYDWLFGYANVALADACRAEEAVQETFRIACDKLSSLLGSESPRGWLVNTLKRVVQSIARKNARENLLFVPFREPEQWADENAYHLPPELLYQDLAETHQYILMQAVSEGMSVRELAMKMGISESACKKRIQRSRSYLRERIQK